MALLFCNSVCFAQGRLTDTLRIMPATISYSDTGWVPISIVNSEILGGYTVRLAFDTALLEVIRNSASDPTVRAVQVRGNFAVFRFGTPEPGVVAGVAISLNPQQRLAIGREIAIRLPFRSREGVQAGRKAQLAFIDAPFDTNASNWFAVLDGSHQYRPIRVPGLVSIGAYQALSLSCPSDVTLYCGDSIPPAVTGYATASDPGATVSYADDTTGGPCPESMVISRTWVAQLFDLEAGCTQTITLSRTLPRARLFPTHPNPFVAGAGRETVIDYYLPVSGQLRISIYDVVGRRMKTLLDEVQDNGDHEVSWNGQDADGNYVPSGIYLCRLSFGGETQMMKIAMMR